MSPSETVRFALDVAVADLAGHSEEWASTSLRQRIGLLERLQPRVVAAAPDMVADAARAKGYAPDSPWAAEDWANGPWAITQFVSALLHVLRRIESGQTSVSHAAVHEVRGRTVVDVFPVTAWDRLLLSGFSAEVWMREGVTPEETVARAGAAYLGVEWRPGVSLVLGAGNVVSITALDILNKLYQDGHVVIAKMNPVNAHLRPHLEAIFGEFVEAGWVHLVDGGAEEGSYLAHHAAVDDVHVTGSAATFDALTWGVGDGSAQRRLADQPLLTKSLTSELGGVSPCIVVPGEWSDADFRFQAEHVVTSKMNNAGHNCIATQVLVVPSEWSGTDRLLTAIRQVLAALPPRIDYYPGATDRRSSIADTHPSAEDFSPAGCGLLVTGLHDDDPLIDTEVFASVLAVVRLPGHGVADYLAAATAFANDQLPGTLGATVIVHPATEAAERDAVDAAVARLRYGTVGVNVWSGVGFLLGYTPWGAFPGHTRQDIGSGMGFVHNAFLLEGVEKTIVRAPFAPMHRGLLRGSPSLSPKPPYFVTNRTGRTTIERVTRFTASPSSVKLPAIFASALRG